MELKITNLANEEWREIEGYEGLYAVSNMGRVANIKRNVLLNPYSIKTGYLQVNLRKDNQGRNFYVHRLVAMAFISNPENKPQVNHKNSIRNDNRAENLEWMTAKENINELHRRTTVSKSLSKPVLCVESGIIYENANKAAEFAKVDASCIRAVCCGRQKTSAGCHWEYVLNTEGNRNGGDTTNYAYKKVQCVETGVIYNSVSEAAKDTGMTR